jgi:hypothetical protein
MKKKMTENLILVRKKEWYILFYLMSQLLLRLVAMGFGRSTMFVTQHYFVSLGDKSQK